MTNFPVFHNSLDSYYLSFELAILNKMQKKKTFMERFVFRRQALWLSLRISIRKGLSIVREKQLRVSDPFFHKRMGVTRS